MANKITQTGSPKDFVDHSYFYKPYMIPAVLGFILWAAYVCWTGYWGIVHGRVPVIDIGIQIAILFLKFLNLFIDMLQYFQCKLTVFY